MSAELTPDATPTPHRRRVRYAGKYPKRFEDKYKEQAAEKYPETIAKVLAAGKTPAGSHVPVMVEEILSILRPQPGEKMIDCTLGFGGHTTAILPHLTPGGKLVGIDVDPIEQPRTVARLRGLGFTENSFTSHRSNFAGLTKVLASEGWVGVDGVLADLGVSSMQLDTPERGFSIKHPGPFDMRMNPLKGESAEVFLAKITESELAEILQENADEPQAVLLASRLAGQKFSQTSDCVRAIRTILANQARDHQDLAARRVFQALRIAVNQEFSVLDLLLRQLPVCLNPGGRVAILTFHSGEDRRVKKSFQNGLRDGSYRSVADEVIRSSPSECRANPRASSAKLRWAIKGE